VLPAPKDFAYLDPDMFLVAGRPEQATKERLPVVAPTQEGQDFVEHYS
jgi:hypothetical protein